MTVDLVQVCASDDMVAQAAKVSTQGSNRAEATQGFIDFLWRNGHSSPFEHNMFTFYIECPIFVAREIMRTRIASYNETSGRYRELDGVFYCPSIYRPLVQVGKTGDYQFESGDNVQKAVVEEAYIDACEQGWESYREMIDAGVAKEVARGVLPVTTFTTLYMTVNAHSLMKFLDLRTDSHAQLEIREVAEKMVPYFRRHMPMTVEAWQKYRA